MSAISAAGLAPSRVTQRGVLRSEWIKLRSLRSTWFSLAAAVLLVDALGTLFSALHAHRMTDNGGPNVQVMFDATEVSLRGVFLAQLAIGVLGVLVITGEYGTGMIRSSLAAVPHRRPVLIAKAAVFAVVTFVVALPMTLIGFELGQLAQRSTHVQADLGTPGALRAIVGAAVYLTLIGVLAVGIGFIVRNTAGALATLFGIVLVAPLLTNALPEPYATDVAKFLPLNIGSRIVATTEFDTRALGPWVGIAVLAGYAAVALAAGAFVLSRRDA
ncbi:MAG TPA: ABC transporter permease [Jatrophihabitans sp.]|jgi:ABC-type transport system involved in multi-copper enzyme maturation permease subunit